MWSTATITWPLNGGHRTFDLGLFERWFGRAFGVDADGRHEQAVQGEVAGGAGGQGADVATGAPVELASGDEGRESGPVLEDGEAFGSVGQDGEVAGSVEGAGEALECGGGVDADGDAVINEVNELGDDLVFARACAAEPVGEQLWSDGHGAATNPTDCALLGQFVEIDVGWSSR